MYDDDGKKQTNHGRKIQFELITFSSLTKKSKQVIEVKNNGGNYPGKPDIRAITFLLIGLPKKRRKFLLMAMTCLKKLQWDETSKTLQLKFQCKNDDEKNAIMY